MEQQAGIGTEIERTEVIVMTGEGIMIVGAETMIAIMIEIEDMIATERENQIDPAVMTQGAGEGHVLVQRNALEIMIGAGTSAIIVIMTYFNLCSLLLTVLATTMPM